MLYNTEILTTLNNHLHDAQHYNVNNGKRQRIWTLNVKIKHNKISTKILGILNTFDPYQNFEPTNNEACAQHINNH